MEYDKKIAQYDKAYKVFLFTATLIILIGVVIGVRQVFVVGDRIDDSTNSTQKSLRCIGQYFTQTDRENVTIKDIDTCTLVRN